MKFGTCVGMDPERIAVSGKVGFDYVETNMTELALADDDKLSKFINALQESGIPCEASNCFIPGDRYRIVGENVDYPSIAEYVDLALERAGKVGIKSAVFGSGGARKAPDGFSLEEAENQIICFLKEIVSPRAEKYGITIAVEPLYKEACNLINLVQEGVDIAKATGCGNIKGLADLFHMYYEKDYVESIAANKGWIHHAHIANPVNRGFPAPGDGFDFAPFIGALKFAGCPRLTIEAGTEDFEKDAYLALEVLKTV